MRSEKSGHDLQAEIAVLCELPPADLVARWVELYGSAPANTMTKDLLARGIAYEMQVRRQCQSKILNT